MLGLHFLIACVRVAIGLVISTFARSSEMAVSLLPIVSLPMVILGGALLPQHSGNWLRITTRYLSQDAHFEGDEALGQLSRVAPTTASIRFFARF